MVFYTGTALIVGMFRTSFKPSALNAQTTIGGSGGGGDEACDIPWRIKNYLYASVVLLAIFLGLLALSFYLEVYRELNPDSHLSRAETGLPVLVAMLIMLVGIPEMLCIIPRIMRLIVAYRAARLLSEEEGVDLRNFTGEAQKEFNGLVPRGGD